MSLLEGTGMSMPAMGLNTAELVFWTQFAFFILILGGIIGFLLYYKKFNSITYIMEKRANNITIIKTYKSKYILLNKCPALKLFRSKLIIPLLEGQRYTFKKGKKDVYYFNQIDSDHIIPLTFIETLSSFKPIEQDMKFWLFEQWRKTESIYGEDNFLKKNALLLLSIGSMIIILVLMMIILSQFGDINEGLMSVATALKEISFPNIIK